MNNLDHRVTVFGISGCSCSGKTTLALVLKNLLPTALIIHQDEFYKLDSLIPKDPETGYDNWDTSEAIDMDLFFNTIKDAINSTTFKKLTSRAKETDEIRQAASWVSEQLGPENMSQLLGSEKSPQRYVIIEGFLYFHDSKFLQLLNGAILAWADFSVLLTRRNSRPGYETKEGFWADPPNYFEKVVWPSYLKFYQPFLNYSLDHQKLHESLASIEPASVAPLQPSFIQQKGLDWINNYKTVRSDKEMTLELSSLEVVRHLLKCLT